MIDELKDFLCVKKHQSKGADVEGKAPLRCRCAFCDGEISFGEPFYSHGAKCFCTHCLEGMSLPEICLEFGFPEVSDLLAELGARLRR